MPDPHREDRTTLRLPADVKAGIKRVLGDADWTLQEFWLACAAMLLRRPKTFLAELEKFRVGERRGRPKKKAPPSER
jgi:hypothetical protein